MECGFAGMDGAIAMSDVIGEGSVNVSRSEHEDPRTYKKMTKRSLQTTFQILHADISSLFLNVGGVTVPLVHVKSTSSLVGTGFEAN